MAEIIDGGKISSTIRKSIKRDIKNLKKRGITPGLATILVGKDPASELYVNKKHSACKEVGIYAENYLLPNRTSEKKLLGLIKKLNRDKKIHGILVQLPLPKKLNEEKILSAIKPEKDVDGFTPENLGRIAHGRETLTPATPKGIVFMLEKITNLKGKSAVIINHSIVVGKPLALMLLNRNATVTVCHVYTKDLKEHTKKADIIITATGIPNLIRADMVKKGSIVIDAGICKTNQGIVGDVDFENVKKKARAITPVPGGVGPMTIAMLLKNTVVAAENPF